MTWETGHSTSAVRIVRNGKAISGEGNERCLAAFEHTAASQMAIPVLYSTPQNSFRLLGS